MERVMLRNLCEEMEEELKRYEKLMTICRDDGRDHLKYWKMHRMPLIEGLIELTQEA